MNERLINVRLDRRRLDKARRLREGGVPLSELVREAIDRRFDEMMRHSSRNVTAMLKEIHTKHPDPADLPERGYDVHDPREARRAIIRKLRKKS
jgi:hypothetical protein